MIKYDKHTSKKTGIIKTQVRVTTEVKRENGKYSKVTVKNFGFLEEQLDQDKFLKQVKQFDLEYHQGKKIFIELDEESCLIDNNKSYNFGYRFLETIYEFLDIESFFKEKSERVTYDLNEIFKYDVLMRILCPGSKRATIQLKDCLYGGNYSFRLHQNYRSLSFFSKYKDSLIRHINEVIKAKIGRDDTLALYDCTNYYFETDFPDEEGGLRQRGVSKEHRTEPIVQMGLFIDTNALPVTYSVFPGNTADSFTIKEFMKEVNNNYGFKHLIIVGDKGFNSKDNITKIINDGNGFIFSNKLRGKGKAKPKYQDKCFDTSNWKGNEDFKYTLFDDEIELRGLDSSNKKLKIKVLIYYKKEIAELEKHRREEKINKAKGYLKDNPGLVSMMETRKSNKYLKEVPYISETGEQADKYQLSLDEERIREEEKLDGFFCLITSETGFTYEEILNSYSQLWMIEESFRISKNDIDTRPAFVYTDEHLKGYFLETFVSLLIMRILQYKMKDNRISVQRIIEVLNSCNCNKLTDDVVHIENIGGRNTFFYKSFKDKEKKQSTLKLVKEVIEDGIDKDELLTQQGTDQIRDDFNKIIKTYKIKEPNRFMRVKDFNNYLKSINFSTIFNNNKKRPGRPKKS